MIKQKRLISTIHIAILGLTLTISTLLILTGGAWANQNNPADSATPPSCEAVAPAESLKAQNPVAKPDPHELQQLTDRLQKSNSKARGDNTTDSKNEAKDVAEQRKQALADQIQANPEEAIEQLLPTQVLDELDSYTENCTERPATIKGSFETIYIDNEDGTHIERHSIRTDSNKRVTVYAAHTADKTLPTGQDIQLEGYILDNIFLYDARNDNNIKVDSNNVDHLPNLDNQGDQKTIVLMPYFQGTSQPSLTKAAVDDMVFNQANEYYEEVTYNQASISGESRDWMQVPVSHGCENYYDVLDAAVAAADASVDFRNYSRILLITNINRSCTWAGLGTVGKTTVPTLDGYVRASVSWIDAQSSNLHRTVTHELGHNFTLRHSRFLDCGQTTLEINIANCTLSEYGNPYSIMGGGSRIHLNSAEKERAGWLEGKVQNVATSGTYTIDSLSVASSGSKAIRIERASHPRYIYFEYRTASGLDSTLDASALSGALLHLSDGEYTALMDATPPANRFTPALSVGGTFVDPVSNTSVTLTSKTASTMTFNVIVGSDNNTPTITTTPNLGSSDVSGTKTVTAQVTASSAIQRVDFYMDSQPPSTPTFTDYTAPYEYTFDSKNLSNGAHSLHITATDSSGNVGSYTTNFVVNNDSVAPQVAITSPANNATVSGQSVALAATATDNVAVSRVEFYADGNLLGTDSNPPYTYTLNSLSLPNGSHTIVARAYDTSNNYSENSISINVVNDTAAPSVELTQPSNSATISNNVQLRANASDDVSISRVEFYIDNVLKYTAAISPYTYDWDTTSVSNGSHLIYAKAYDASNKLTTSSHITVTVNNSAPRVPLYRVWHPATNDHSNTTNIVERDWLISTAGYRSEGITAYVYATPKDGTAPLYRVWHPPSNDHSNTTNLVERDWLVSTAGYRAEGVTAYVYTTPGGGRVPLYRVWHPATNDHSNTTNIVERDWLISTAGYRSEGITAYVYATPN